MKANTPEEQARMDSQKDAKGNIRKTASLRDVAKKQLVDTAIKQGVGLAGQGISSATSAPITVTGTLPNGNFQLSDGGVTTPSGEVVTEGSTSQNGQKYATAIMAAINLYNTWSNKNATPLDKGVGTATAGLQLASTIDGAEIAGPIGSGVQLSYGAYKILNSNMTPEQKAKALRRTGEDAAANYVTGGVWGVAQALDRKLLGGQTDRVRNEVDRIGNTRIGKVPILPAVYYGNKVLEKAMSLGGSGKGGDQQQRDAYRKAFAQMGLIKGGDDYNLNFSDKSKFDIGLDGGATLKNDAGKERSYKDVDLEDKRSGVAIANLAPLTTILTGGNKERGQDFTGYFTNAVLSGNADDATRLKRTRELYDQSKVTRDIALAKINEMEKAGTLDAGTAAVNRANVDQVFGVQAKAPTTAQPQQKAPEKKAPVKKPTLKDIAPTKVADVLPQMAPPPTIIEPDDTPAPEEEQDVFNYKKMIESFARRNAA